MEGIRGGESHKGFQLADVRAWNSFEHRLAANLPADNGDSLWIDERLHHDPRARLERLPHDTRKVGSDVLCGRTGC